MRFSTLSRQDTAFPKQRAGWGLFFLRLKLFMWEYIKSFFYVRGILSIGLLVCIVLFYTKAGQNIFSCFRADMPDMGIMLIRICEKCNYQSLDLSIFIALSAIFLVVYLERDAIIDLVDLSVYTHLHKITATMTLLIVATYCLIEVVFGIGEGYEWASDYVVAYVAAWSLRLILSWNEYGRRLAGEAALEREEEKAEAAVQKSSDFWFHS